MLRKLLLSTMLAVAGSLWLTSVARGDDPGRINAYVTPYYDSSGPVIRIGKYSAGLASKNPGDFVATILRMKKQWRDLNLIELYVGAIRLYDLGYRKEATYWFYTAQYRGRLFGLLIDQKKMGSIGNRGFELFHAQDAFFQLVGPDINGYAFGDIDWLVGIIRRVQNDNRTVPNLQTIYPGVAVKPKSQWQSQNLELDMDLGQLAGLLTSKKDEIRRQRAQNGTQARFSQLPERQFPGGL